jgi:hypothetical protein
MASPSWAAAGLSEGPRCPRRARAADWLPHQIYAPATVFAAAGHTWRAHGRSLAYLSGRGCASDATTPPPTAGRRRTHACSGPAAPKVCLSTTRADDVGELLCHGSERAPLRACGMLPRLQYLLAGTAHTCIQPTSPTCGAAGCSKVSAHFIHTVRFDAPDSVSM